MSARVRIATIALLGGLATAGCGPTTDPAGPGGGASPTAAPSTGTVAGPTPGPWPNPSARPMDRVLRTGMRIGDDELLLSPSTSHIVDTAWFDTRTGRYHSLPEDENFRSAYGDDKALTFFEVRERPAPDGRLITFGYASARVARATISQPGYPTATLTVAPWAGEADTSLFWTARRGRSMTGDVPADQRAVCVLYDQAGRVLGRLLLAEAQGVQKGG